LQSNTGSKSIAARHNKNDSGGKKAAMRTGEGARQSGKDH
jgi:hypothetical protein